MNENDKIDQEDHDSEECPSMLPEKTLKTRVQDLERAVKKLQERVTLLISSKHKR